MSESVVAWLIMYHGLPGDILLVIINHIDEWQY